MSRGLDRRTVLVGAGSALAVGLLGRVAQGAGPASVSLDFRGQIPPGVRFRRPSSATVVDGAGRVRSCASDVPRFVERDGKAGGLLIEGGATNLVRSSADLRHPSWTSGGGVGVELAGAEIAPDGSTGVFRIRRPAPRADSECRCSIVGATGEGYGAGSIWLRSPSGPGRWPLRMRDFKTYDTTGEVVEVGPEWRRYGLMRYWQSRDTGWKRLAVLNNEKPVDGVPAEILAWGGQYESGSEPSSLIPTNGRAAERTADEVTFPAQPLNRPQGRLTISLPDGGRRGGVLLDTSNGGTTGLRIEYSNSGWIMGCAGACRLTGLVEVTADRIVELQWSPAGVQIATGPDPAQLKVRAAVRSAPSPIDCGALARLGMTMAGEQPLNRAIATLVADDRVGAIQVAATPVFVPAGYKLSFADEFDDPDVGRINENAVGGRPGAPAWRSRYRQPRKDVINKEKQIFMDPAFAGTAGHPLGVQPFSIADSVLKIRGDRADPDRVSPFIWNYKYTSGCITSEFTHAQKYGYYEMSARLPLGKGFWPAFWLLPKRDAWPPEIDVFEGFGHLRTSLHQGMIETSKGGVGRWVRDKFDVADGFHLYAMEWTEQKVAFFVDGAKTMDFDNHHIHEEMYVLANLAIGSHDAGWVPDPDRTTPFPGFYEIDYIRVYARS